MTEQVAVNLFMTAITKRRAAELLTCLFEGGTGTVNPEGELILIPGDALSAWAEQQGDDG